MDGLGKEPSWPDLLPELGGFILRLLLCQIDRLRFRCVCRRWRLVERQQRPLLPPALPFICLNNRGFLSLSGGEVRRVVGSPQADDISCRGCFDGWLLYGPKPHLLDFYGDLRTGFLINPLSGATVEMPVHLNDLARSSVMYMRKAIVCSPDLIAAFLGGSSFAFYRPGAPSWSVCRPSDDDHDARRRGSYVDVAFYRGKLYGLNDVDELFIHKIAGDGAPEAAASHVVEHAIKAQGPRRTADPEETFIRCHYLVVSCTGKLLMVKWTVPPFYRRSSPASFDGITVEVYEADLEVGRWLEVNSLDNGEALFVGRGCSKAVRFTGNDERFQGNRVYVLGYDNFFGYCCNAMPSYGFYDLGNGTIGRVLLDRMRVAAWPVSKMEWFFPLE
ncbi:hypothetical protein BAE44_0013572 [Dichanthelium oligosanthes]|uniref:KIB1-4 beta-propeller domain-containing protein n=1 Tax=Dichanthelium oligosanthes TaxID=888268 RepID=A0A1E5VJX8_9POAL|nr:hypothetical protein BAE44_0013572 [Dichanthelium oligosanthes]